MDDMSSCQLSVISVLSRNNKKRRKEIQDTWGLSLFLGLTFRSVVIYVLGLKENQTKWKKKKSDVFSINKFRCWSRQLLNSETIPTNRDLAIANDGLMSNETDRRILLATISTNGFGRISYLLWSDIIRVVISLYTRFRNEFHLEKVLEGTNPPTHRDVAPCYLIGVKYSTTIKL